MKKILRAIGLAVLSGIMLGGCATNGYKEFPVEFTNGRRLTIMSYSNWLPEYLIPLSQRHVSYIVDGAVTTDQLENVARAETACRFHTQNARASNPVLVITNTALFFLAGYWGVGLGAKALGSTVQYHQYARYGGTAAAFSGAASGIITLGGQSYTFKNCTRDMLDQAKIAVRVLADAPY